MKFLIFKFKNLNGSMTPQSKIMHYFTNRSRGQSRSSLLLKRIPMRRISVHRILMRNQRLKQLNSSEKKNQDKSRIISTTHKWYKRVKALEHMGGCTTAVHIGRSPIAKNGIFTKRFFKKDSIIMVYTGDIINKAEQKRRAEAGVGDTFAGFTKGMVVDGKNKAKYVNHSCQPNSLLELLTFEDGTAATVITAARNVRKGEEITIDYKWIDDKEIPCNCGSPVCRGSITRVKKKKMLTN